MTYPRHQQLNEDSHTITTVEPSDDLRYLFKRTLESNHKRNYNYVLDEKTLDISLCYSVTYLKDVPVLGSLAWVREFHSDAVRVVTKYCLNPDNANTNFGKGTDGVRIDMIDHIEQQCKIGEERGYKKFFLTQEDRSPTGRRARWIAKVLTKYTGRTWTCSDERILVAPNPKDKTCWQWVISTDTINFDYTVLPWWNES